MTMTLEQRVARLEAHNDICKLMAEYLLVADRGYDPDGITAMFVDNGIWEGDGFGRFEGRQAIWDFFKGLSGSLVFAAHFVTNPIITFEADDLARGLLAADRARHREQCRQARLEPARGRLRQRVRQGRRHLEIPVGQRLRQFLRTDREGLGAFRALVKPPPPPVRTQRTSP